MRKSAQDIQTLRSALGPLQILVSSASEATLAHLNTMLEGFEVDLVSSVKDAKAYLNSYPASKRALDFIILDDQSETHTGELVRYLQSFQTGPSHATKVLHLYTPTKSRPGYPVFGNSSTPGVVKLTKPPRKVRLLQTLASLKNLPISFSQPTSVTQAMEDLAAAQQSLFGNVLIAEGSFFKKFKT